MEHIVLAIIACFTILAIVYRLYPVKTNNCEDVVIFQKESTTDNLIKESQKFDVFTIKKSTDGRMHITAYNHDYGEYY